MSLIDMKGIVKTYNAGTPAEITVLHAVDVAVRQGEFMAIMGPSGSGKSTLMHLMGFLDTATDGRYLFGDEDVTHLSERRLAKIRNATVGFVFQAFHLLQRTTALDNVRLPMQYAGVGKGEQIRRATAALERVGLGDRLEHKPNELSGGQQQRVSIARALVMNPSIIFADEPTGNLDSVSSGEIMQILIDLNRAGTTIVMVTHEDEIAAIAQRKITLKDGRIVSDVRL